MSAEGNRKLELVKDPDEALSLLREASKGLAATMIWTQRQEKVIHTSIHVFSEAEQTLYVALPADVDPRKFVEELAASGTRDCYFSVSLLRANIFFKTGFIGYDAGFKFHAPDLVFRVQRRSDLRFPIPGHQTLKVEFQDPLFEGQRATCKAIDLSAGGMAILVTETDAAAYVPGLVLRDLTFTLNQRPIRCDAEIRHVSPIRSAGGSPPAGHKLGLLFKKLSPADTQHIAAWVMEECRRYFQSFSS